MVNTPGRVYSIKKFNLGIFKPKDKIQIFFIFLVICGIISGAFLFSQKQGSGKIAESIFNNYIHIHSFKKQYKVFFSVLVQYIVYSVTVYFLGVSVTGVVTIPFMIFIFGFLTGDMLSYTFAVFELKGIAFNAIILIPPTIIYLIGLINVSKSTFEFSLKLSKSAVNKRNSVNIYMDFRILCKKMLIMLLFCLGSALTDVVLYSILGSYFDF